jgi:hypothetical protein
VPAEDVEALEAALEEMLYDDDAAAAARAAVAEIAPEYRWSRTLAPLVEFCRHPRRAADLAVPDAAEPAPRRRRGRPRPSAKDDLELARAYLRAGGLKEVSRRAAGRARRVMGRDQPG